MDLTFPLRWRGFRDVADVSLPQGRLRGADELIDSRQDLRARKASIVSGTAGQHITASRPRGCRTGYGVTVWRRKHDGAAPGEPGRGPGGRQLPWHATVHPGAGMLPR